VRPIFLMIALLSTACVAQEAANPPKPAPPSAEVPALQTAKVSVLCVDCPDPFDLTIHKGLLDDLAANPYIGELRRALYVQDVLHQFESRAHFDNCAFSNALDYIDNLFADADKHAAAAEAAKSGKKPADSVAAARRAFFSLGQALHAIQDFYAHTNYVELNVADVKRVTDIPVMRPWRAEDRNKILDMQAAGLRSGYVFWGFPQYCPKGTLSHGEMAKDSASTAKGGQRIPHLTNHTHFQVAESLAREASLQLMKDAFQRWPLLRELNGDKVAFEVLVDRRGL
jgi:hypothetical protein